MNAASDVNSAGPHENPFSAADIESILRERGWLTPTANRPEALEKWLERAAALLGPQAKDRTHLADLLSLIFHYDAAGILREPDSHAVLAREGARDVIRELALILLDGPPLDSDRFKVIVEAVKGRVQFTSRDLFYPLRLALAGRAGGGELDRVILLIDAAAEVPGLAPVKKVHQRMFEFCSALE
jgi:Anticodon binding domain